MIDRGANRGLGGSDVILLEETDKTADVTGIDNHKVQDLKIGTCAGVVNTVKGRAVVLLHQYAYHGKGKTIHSCGQMESFQDQREQQSRKIKGGKQRIQTPDGHVIPLSFRGGLPYMKMTPPTASNLESLPHILLMSDMEWDPTTLDDDDNFGLKDFVDSKEEGEHHGYDAGQGSFGLQGGYQHRVVAESVSEQFFDTHQDQEDVDKAIGFILNKSDVKKKEPDFDRLRSCLGWAPMDIVKKTISKTTQFVWHAVTYLFRKHYTSCFPAANIHQRQEAVATDTIYSNTPAVCGGHRCAQLFFGVKTHVTDAYPMKTNAEFVNTLEDNIRSRELWISLSATEHSQRSQTRW